MAEKKKKEKNWVQKLAEKSRKAFGKNSIGKMVKEGHSGRMRAKKGKK